MRILISFAILIVAFGSAQAATVHRAKSASYKTEIAAAKIIKSKCKSCDDIKIREAILRAEASKGPYAKEDELARDVLKSLR